MKNMSEIITEAKTKAVDAIEVAKIRWEKDWGGNEYGEPMYCGFAWVEVKQRSNTKLAKALLDCGFSKSHTRAGILECWNPSEYGGQSLDFKEIGAEAFAEHLNTYGIKAHACSRPD